MSDNRPIKAKIQDNQKRKCKVPSCRTLRSRISPYCTKHNWRNWYWGHPEAGRIYPKEYASEIAEVRRVVLNNLSHPGIQQGREFFERWTKAASRGLGPCPEVIGRLTDGWVTAEVMLIEMAAVYLFARRNLGGRVKSDRHCTYLLGNKLIRIIPYWTHTKGTQHKACGEYVMENIGVLLLNICDAVDRMEQKRSRTLLDMHKKLEVPTDEV